MNKFADLLLRDIEYISVSCCLSCRAFVLHMHFNSIPFFNYLPIRVINICRTYFLNFPVKVSKRMERKILSNIQCSRLCNRNTLGACFGAGGDF